MQTIAEAFDAQVNDSLQNAGISKTNWEHTSCAEKKGKESYITDYILILGPRGDSVRWLFVRHSGSDCNISTNSRWTVSLDIHAAKRMNCNVVTLVLFISHHDQIQVHLIYLFSLLSNTYKIFNLELLCLISMLM